MSQGQLVVLNCFKVGINNRQITVTANHQIRVALFIGLAKVHGLKTWITTTAMAAALTQRPPS